MKRNQGRQIRLISWMTSITKIKNTQEIVLLSKEKTKTFSNKTHKITCSSRTVMMHFNFRLKEVSIDMILAFPYLNRCQFRDSRVILSIMNNDFPNSLMTKLKEWLQRVIMEMKTDHPIKAVQTFAHLLIQTKLPSKNKSSKC